MIHVIFGSQTGNSEEIAKRIYKEIKEKFKLSNDSIELSVMNKFLQKIQKIPENKSSQNIIIAVCSTTGAGDAPTNSDNFIRWIKRKTLSPDTLSNVYYTVLGLGDSNYTKYQFIPKQVDDCLSKLGAVKFYNRGEADDAYGLEIVVEPWIEALYPILENLVKKIKKQDAAKLEKDDLTSESRNTEKKINIDTYLNDYKIVEDIKSKLDIHNENPADNLNMNFPIVEDENSYNNSVLTHKTLISGSKSDKRIFSIKFKPRIFERQLDLTNYSPGASISLLPPESEERLNIIFSVITSSDEYLHINKSQHFNVYSDFLEKYPHFKKFLEKGFLTKNEIFKYVIDFDSVLRKLQSGTLINFLKSKINNKEVHEKLEILFSKYTDLILKNKISLFDIMRSISLYKISLPLSLIEILENFPIKYPRNYSLVSIPRYENSSNEDILEIIFSVVDERIIRKFPNIKFNNLLLGITPGEYFYKGQATNYLKDLNVGSQMFVCGINKDSFNFPINSFSKNEIPIIYICNGTGISPCISFIRQLLQLETNPRENNKDLKLGELLILTGFRNATVERNETIYENFIHKASETLKKSSNGREIINYKRCVSSSEENEEEEVGIWRNYRINTQYVQDLIIEYQDKVYDLLFIKKGYLMICGDIQKLYDECIENILSILIKKVNLSREHCVKIIEDMKINERIRVEKWI